MAEPFVLLSYHRRDEAWKERVVARLEGVVPVVAWPLRDDAAPPWLTEREQALHSARAAVLLVSHNSQDSAHRTGIEQPLLRERHGRGEAEVMTLLIERLPGAEAFDGTAFSAAGGRTLSELSDAEADRLLDLLGQALRASLATARAAESAPEEDLDELFDRLYGDYFPALVWFFTRRGLEPEECHDLAQDTMLKVYKGLGGLKGRQSPSAWIRKIAVNVWNNYVRGRWGTHKRRGRETSLEHLRETSGDWSEGEALWPTGDTDPPRRISATEDRARIAAVVPRLPSRQRECLVLWLEGYKYTEMADRLGISIETVKTSIYKAKAGIVKLLARSENPGDPR